MTTGVPSDRASEQQEANVAKRPSSHAAHSFADRLQAALTRRAVVRGGAVAGLGVLASGAVLARAQPGVSDIVDQAITIEAFVVTLLGVARDRGRRLDLSDEDVRFLRAAQCEDEAHYHFFQAAGGTPATETFSIANATFVDRETFFRALVEVEALCIGAYMAAARQFAAVGDGRLVEIAYQFGAVEAQHLALAKALLGERLPADRAFARWRFRDTGEAVAALTGLGFIGGGGKKYDYPGPVDRICRGVFGLVPETTDDQEPDPATPVATPTG
ncbi:MAG: ferritin-like domain-containing protein [Thermomicrobiales bacterium]